MSERKEPLTVFHCDLDNTLIYSWKHEIGEEKVCVEVYEGREISFMTTRSSALLRQVRERTVFVPTTTRTKEQYERIRLETAADGPQYALVCNGGVLLRDGEELPDWYGESLRRIEKSREELAEAQRRLQKDGDRCFEVRNIRDLFLFTKSVRPRETAERLRAFRGRSSVNVFTNGNKVYAVPEGLDKGTALARFREYIHADRVLAAGDSEFDLPMLAAADEAFAPAALFDRHPIGKQVQKIGQGVFSDGMLHMVLSGLSIRGKDGSVPYPDRKTEYGAE